MVPAAWREDCQQVGSVSADHHEVAIVEQHALPLVVVADHRRGGIDVDPDCHVQPPLSVVEPARQEVLTEMERRRMANEGRATRRPPPPRSDGARGALRDRCPSYHTCAPLGRILHRTSLPPSQTRFTGRARAGWTHGTSVPTLGAWRQSPMATLRTLPVGLTTGAAARQSLASSG